MLLRRINIYFKNLDGDVGQSAEGKQITDDGVRGKLKKLGLAVAVMAGLSAVSPGISAEELDKGSSVDNQPILLVGEVPVSPIIQSTCQKVVGAINNLMGVGGDSSGTIEIPSIGITYDNTRKVPVNLVGVKDSYIKGKPGQPLAAVPIASGECGIELPNGTIVPAMASDGLKPNYKLIKFGLTGEQNPKSKSEFGGLNGINEALSNILKLALLEKQYPGIDAETSELIPTMPATLTLEEAYSLIGEYIKNHPDKTFNLGMDFQAATSILLDNKRGTQDAEVIFAYATLYRNIIEKNNSLIFDPSKSGVLLSIYEEIIKLRPELVEIIGPLPKLKSIAQKQQSEDVTHNRLLSQK